MFAWGPFTGYGGKKQTTGGLDTQLILQLWEVARKSPIVSSVLEMAATWASTSAWHVEIEMIDDSAEAKEPTRRLAKSDNQLNQILSKQLESQIDTLIKHVLVFGFAVVQYRLVKRRKSSEVTSADIKVEVLHPHTYTLRYTMNKRGERKWFAFRQTSAVNKNYEEIPHSRVFMREIPEPFSGAPNSPLMRCMRTVYQYDSLIATMEIVGHKKAFPPFIYKNTSKAFPLPAYNKPIVGQGSLARQAAPMDGSSSDFYGFTTDEEQASYLARAQLRKNATQAMRNIHNFAADLDGMDSQTQLFSRMNKDYIDDFIETAKQHPTQPEKVLAEDITLESSIPKAETLSEFSSLEEIFKSQIAVALGVPLEFIFPHRGRFSSDILLSKKIMSIRNSKLHKWLATVIERVCLDIHYDSIFNLIESLAAKFAESDVEGGEIASQHILKQKYIDSLKDIVLVTVHFDENTVAAEESLLTALRTSVIDHNTYSDLMLSSLGLARSLKAVFPDNVRAEIESQLRESTGPEPTQPSKRQKTTLDDENDGEEK
jgi:uncharacterized protein YnzC (UPF0291/DUF896 family)